MLKEKILKKYEYKEKNDFKVYLEKIKDENIKFYIETRIIGQINWYDKESIYNQKIYKHLNRISIILGGSIPVLTVLIDYYWWIKVVIAGLGSVVMGISSINTLCNYKELWTRYRINCEILKSNLYVYFARQGIYKELSDEQAFKQLVTICEGKFIEEFNDWSVLINSEDKLNDNHSI